LVRTHFAPSWCWDKPHATLDSLDSPRLGFGGSHHLPPYSIFCSSPPHLHPNGSFSRDSQNGVPKLSRFGLSGLWTLITPRPKLGLGRGLNQSCSSLQEISNGVLHFTCMYWNRVDLQLWVVRSQTVSLTLHPSFDHNLCCKCPNGSCEAILDIYTSRPFQWYKERFNARFFYLYNCALSFWESRRTPKSHFRECEWRPHTSLKVGLRHSMSSWGFKNDFNSFFGFVGLRLGFSFLRFLRLALRLGLNKMDLAYVYMSWIFYTIHGFYIYVHISYNISYGIKYMITYHTFVWRSW
jgi:hypothetical protein